MPIMTATYTNAASGDLNRLNLTLIFCKIPSEKAAMARIGHCVKSCAVLSGMTVSTPRAMYRMAIKVFGAESIVNPFYFFDEGSLNIMARTETVEFTNMCMICDGSRVVVIDRKKRDWPGITFPGGHIEPGESFTDAVIREVQEETGLHIRSPQLCGIKDWCENQCRLLCCFIRQLVLIIKTKPLVKLFFEKEKKSKKRIEKATVYLLPGMQEKSIGCNIIRIAMQM